MTTDIDIEELIDIETDTENPWKVLLFNDEDHSFDEVILQVQKAKGCSLEEAIEITLTAHSSGQAIVKIDTMEECERVAGVLRQIQLCTCIERA